MEMSKIAQCMFKQLLSHPDSTHQPAQWLLKVTNIFNGCLIFFLKYLVQTFHKV